MFAAKAAGFRFVPGPLVVLGAFGLLPAIVWLIGVGDIWAYFSHELPAGQLLYLFSKLFGLYAYFFMTVQMVIGAQGGGSRYFAYHPRVGAAATLMVLLHLGFFITAASLRAKHLVADNFIPDFSQGFYKGAVSLGIISAYLLMLVVLAAVLRRKLGSVLRIVHKLAYAVVLLGGLHAFTIGTETRIPIVMTFYALLLILASWSLLVRLRRSFSY